MTPELTPPQHEVFSSGILSSGFNAILHMPTGSGKTWLAEQAIRDVLDKGMRAIYLTPLRALADELVRRWTILFEEFPVGIFTGDFGHSGSPYPVSFADAKLLVMTPERLDACTRNWKTHWKWLPYVDLLVVDEFHLLGDKGRGSHLEGTLSRIRRLNPFVQILGLSATMGNVHELAEWLDGVAYQSSWRPVPLTWRLRRYRNPRDKLPLLVDELRVSKSTQKRTLVFVQSRRRAEEISTYLNDFGFVTLHHHAGLTHAQRKQVEHAFRETSVDAVITTSTLEMGLNMPVDQVILYDLQFFDGDFFQPLPTNNVWQRVGRAGRPGLNSAGQAVLFAPNWDGDANRYEEGRFEPIRSSLSDERFLAEQIVVEVASNLASSSVQLKQILRQSLAAHQGNLPDVDKLITSMLAANMLVENENGNSVHSGSRLKATRLGWIAVRHFLSPATIQLFEHVLKEESYLTFFDLLLLVACSKDCQPLVTVDFEELGTLTDLVNQEQSIILQYGRDYISELLVIDGKRLLSAIKMAHIMRSWTRKGNFGAVADEHTCYAFEVSQLKDCYCRLLQAMESILEEPTDDEVQMLNDAGEVSMKERIRTLSQMVNAGLDEFAVTLTLIPGVGPKFARRLQSVGILDIEEFALAEPENLLVPGVSESRIRRWIVEAEALLDTRSALSYQETGLSSELAQFDWPANIDPYRLRRAHELSVRGADGDRFLVTGGLEPHVVITVNSQYQCDCMDYRKGHQCKHIFAVRLFQNDTELNRLTAQLYFNAQASDQFDLFELWFKPK